MVNERKRSFYNATKGAYRYIANYIMPDIASTQIRCLQYETAPEEEISIEISSPVLQTLTSPLKWQDEGSERKDMAPWVVQNSKIVQNHSTFL